MYGLGHATDGLIRLEICPADLVGLGVGPHLFGALEHRPQHVALPAQDRIGTSMRWNRSEKSWSQITE